MVLFRKRRARARLAELQARTAAQFAELTAGHEELIERSRTVHLLPRPTRRRGAPLTAERTFRTRSRGRE